MQQTTEEYRGYTIAVTPSSDHDDLWDYEYQLARIDGTAAPLAQRAGTAGGHISAEAAMAAGIEVARTEVDNLLALEPSAG